MTLSWKKSDYKCCIICHESATTYRLFTCFGEYIWDTRFTYQNYNLCCGCHHALIEKFSHFLNIKEVLELDEYWDTKYLEKIPFYVIESEINDIKKHVNEKNNKSVNTQWWYKYLIYDNFILTRQKYINYINKLNNRQSFKMLKYDNQSYVYFVPNEIINYICSQI